jgi:hypothetical protein
LFHTQIPEIHEIHYFAAKVRVVLVQRGPC